MFSFWRSHCETSPFDLPGSVGHRARGRAPDLRRAARPATRVSGARINDGDAKLTEPMAYERVPGQGKAADGGDRFDLDRFNPDYFDRLEQRVEQAGERGI